MRVLVTGGAGFIGQHVVKELQSLDIPYISLQRGRSNDSSVKQINLFDNSDLHALFKEIKPTHLIHMAWYTEHGKYWDSELNLKFIETTNNLVEAFCASGGKHVVITGTCAEYDWSHGYCVEGITPLIPKSLYGVAKDTTRRVVETVVKQYSVSLTWARIFFPYGSGETKNRLIPSLLKVFKGEISPFGVNVNSYRDLLHVEDVARGIMTCLENNIDGVINICSGKPVKISEIVCTIAKITRSDANLILKLRPSIEDEFGFLVGNNTRLKNYRWTQNIDLEEGLLKYKL
jgi:nucleoside-diphosphate-sugar epimerase